MTQEKPKLIAIFQPQADMPGGHIQDIDGAVDLDITRWFLRQDLATVRSIVAQAGKSHGKDLDLIAEASDVLLRRHTGPYEVKLDLEDIETFLQDSNGTSVASLDEDALVRLRKEFAVLGYEIPHPVGEDMFLGPQPAIQTGKSLEIDLLDWRVQDKADDELSEAQKKPWKMIVSEGGWGASIDFIAPDGTRRSVAIEINLGNPKLATYTSGDEVDAFVTLGRENTHVTSNAAPVNPAIEAVIVDTEGVRKAPAEADADFADESPAPGPR